MHEYMNPYAHYTQKTVPRRKNAIQNSVKTMLVRRIVNISFHSFAAIMLRQTDTERVGCMEWGSGVGM